MSNKPTNVNREETFLRNAYNIESSLYELRKTSTWFNDLTTYIKWRCTCTPKEYEEMVLHNNKLNRFLNPNGNPLGDYYDRLVGTKEIISRDLQRLKETKDPKSIQISLSQPEPNPDLFSSTVEQIRRNYGKQDDLERKLNDLNKPSIGDALIKIGAVVAILGLILMIVSGNFYLRLLPLSSGLVMFCLGKAISKQNELNRKQLEDKVKEEYVQEFNQNKLKEYNAKKSELEKELEDTLQVRNQICTEGSSELKNRSENVIRAIDAQKKVILTTIRDLKATLDKLYATNLLHEKYRSLQAVSTMLEYFETSRCFEFAGPNGAYNLYESELRSELILSKLDEISAKLDMIQKNQHALYVAINRANNTLQSIESELTRHSEMFQRITDNQEKQLKLTALNTAYAAATAANTEAIKYLTLLR